MDPYLNAQLRYLLGRFNRHEMIVLGGDNGCFAGYQQTVQEKHRNQFI